MSVPPSPNRALWIFLAVFGPLAVLLFLVVRWARLSLGPMSPPVVQGLAAMLGGLLAGVLASTVGYRVARWWLRRQEREGQP